MSNNEQQIEMDLVPAGALSPTPEKRSFLKAVKEAVDKAAGVIAKNKTVAAALVSLFAIAGVVSAEDAGTWTNVATAVATVISAVL